MGARDGPEIPVTCPAADSFRSVAAFLTVPLLLLLRKPNRGKEAWLLLIPLTALYIVLGTAERLLNGYLVFHYHQYICSALADLLWFFAVSLGLLLAIADRLAIPWRFLRFVLVGLLLFLANSVQIALNAWPFLDAGRWTMIFGIILALFLIGHALVKALLHWAAGRNRFRWWYAGFCLLFGLLPPLVFLALDIARGNAVQLQSSFEKFRMLAILASAVCLPYAMFFAMVVLGLRSCLWRERLKSAFGLRDLAAEVVVEPDAALPGEAKPPSYSAVAPD